MTTIHLSPSPALTRLAQRAFPDYSGHTFKVRAAESVTCNSHWDGGSRSYYVVLQGNLAEAISETGTPFTPAAPIVTLDAQTIVLEHQYFCGRDMGITIHVHPSALPQLLPQPDTANSLTWAQRVVLCATRSLTPEYQLNLWLDCRTVRDYARGIRHTGCTGLLRTLEMQRRYPHINRQPADY